jgi:subtilisin family serine protease
MLTATARATPISNDPEVALQWYLANQPLYPNGPSLFGTPGVDIGGETAWKRSLGSKVVVAVVDTGIQLDHADLASQLWRNPNEPINGVDDDHDGFVDDVNGANFVSGNGNPDDPNGHGTANAGIIAAATGNREGIAGIAPQASLMAVRVVGAGGECDEHALAAGIRYAVDHGARIINISIIGFGRSHVLARSLRYAGANDVLVVFAAGNSAQRLDQGPNYPASFHFVNTITVTASDADDRLAVFAARGPHSIQIAAPGVSIYTTDRGNTYASRSGTSQAAPMVAGAAALVWALNPALTAAQVKRIILGSADRVAELAGAVDEGRRLNAAAALDLAAS